MGAENFKKKSEKKFHKRGKEELKISFRGNSNLWQKVKEAND